MISTDFRTVCLLTSNEHNQVQIELEYNQTFVQWIMRKPGTVLTAYLHRDGQWYNKESGVEMGWTDQHTLDTIHRHFV